MEQPDEPADHAMVHLRKTLGIDMSWSSEFIGMLERVPPAFWGVVFGSFFSLGGVALTNRANDRRLREQLAHDRELGNRDRALAIRRDVYLAATEAIQEGIMSVLNFGNLEIPFGEVPADYLKKAASIAKIHVIATPKTVRAVLSLLSEIGAAYLRLAPMRMQLDFERQELTRLGEQIKGSTDDDARAGWRPHRLSCRRRRPSAAFWASIAISAPTSPTPVSSILPTN